MRLVRRDPHAQHGRRVEVGEEDQDVVLLLVALEVLEQRRAPRPLLPQPLDLVVAGVRAGEDPLRVAVEGLDVAGARVGEPPDGDAADAVGAFGILVLPGDVVLRAGREHFDLVLGGEPLGDEPAVILGAAEDLGAVALDDESYLQILLSTGLTPSADRLCVLFDRRALNPRGWRVAARWRRHRSSEHFRSASLDPGGAKSLQAAALALEHAVADPPIVYERAEHLGREFEILRGEQHPGAAERFRHRARRRRRATGTSAAIASTSGTQNPSCSLSET